MSHKDTDELREQIRKWYAELPEIFSPNLSSTDGSYFKVNAEDVLKLTQRITLQARIDERGKVVELVKNQVFNNEAIEIDNGQYDEYGRTEVPPSILMGLRTFTDIVDNIAKDVKTDYIAITFDVWEKYVSPHYAYNEEKGLMELKELEK